MKGRAELKDLRCVKDFMLTPKQWQLIVSQDAIYYDSKARDFLPQESVVSQPPQEPGVVLDALIYHLSSYCVLISKIEVEPSSANMTECARINFYVKVMLEEYT